MSPFHRCFSINLLVRANCLVYPGEEHWSGWVKLTRTNFGRVLYSWIFSIECSRFCERFLFTENCKWVMKKSLYLMLFTGSASTVLGGVFGMGWGNPGVQWGRGIDFYCCVFDCCCRGLISGGESGRWVMFPPKFEIFLMSPYFLGSEVLSHSATREATSISSLT